MFDAFLVLSCFFFILNGIFANFSETSDPYEILGLHRNATDKEIKEAYLMLSKQYHPDSQENSNLKHKKEAIQKKFIQVQEAYKTLLKQKHGTGEEFLNKSGQAVYYDSYSNQKIVYEHKAEVLSLREEEAKPPENVEYFVGSVVGFAVYKTYRFMVYLVVVVLLLEFVAYALGLGKNLRDLVFNILWKFGSRE